MIIVTIFDITSIIEDRCLACIMCWTTGLCQVALKKHMHGNMYGTYGTSINKNKRLS